MWMFWPPGSTTNPLALALDDLVSPWTLFRLIYAISPVQILPLLLCTIKEQKKSVILIAPNWLKRPYHIAHPLTTSQQARPAVPRLPVSSCFLVTGFDGMVIETQVLKDRGISDSVTLLKKCATVPRNLQVFQTLRLLCTLHSAFNTI